MSRGKIVSEDFLRLDQYVRFCLSILAPQLAWLLLHPGLLPRIIPFYVCVKKLGALGEDIELYLFPLRPEFLYIGTCAVILSL